MFFLLESISSQCFKHHNCQKQFFVTETILGNKKFFYEIQLLKSVKEMLALLIVTVLF